MAERFNSKLQEIKLAGRGYRTFEKFKSAILFFHGGLDLYHTKPSRTKIFSQVSLKENPPIVNRQWDQNPP